MKRFWIPIVALLVAFVVAWGGIVVNWQTLWAGLLGEPIKVQQSVDDTTELNEKLAEIAALNEQIDSYKKQTVDYKKRLEEYEAQVAVLYQQLAELESDLNAKKDDAADLAALVATLSTQLEQALLELSASAKLTEQLQAQVAAGIQSIIELSTRLDQALNDLNIATSLIAQQQSQISEDALEIAKLLNRLEQALTALATLQAEYDALVNDASVKTPVSFATDNWATIAANPDFYSVGDEREEEWTEGEVTTIVILGKNHDELADGSGKKAALTLGTKTLLAKREKMNSTNTNQGGWDASEMRTVVMPALFASLPSELRTVIKTVNKPTANGSQSTEGVIVNSPDKLWLFSRAELSTTSPTTTLEGEGEIYEYWSTRDSNSARKKYYKTTADSWWTRSPHYSSSSGSFLVLSTAGAFQSGNANTDNRISFGFCVGVAA